MTKFKVGDKVRILDENGIIPNAYKFKNGEVVKVIEVAPSGIVLLRKSDGNSIGVSTSEFGAIEKVSDTPTKNQRITTLESEVAELKAKVEALEKAQQHRKIVNAYTAVLDQRVSRKKMSLTPNEQRKAIIAEAKAFVAETQRKQADYTVDNEGNDYLRVWLTTSDFVVNADKRTVVVIVRKKYGDRVILTKGIAKCAPDDVFNADIGKAIALGRALGLDVSRFEQAVKPTELEVGMKTNHGEVKAVRPTHRESTGERFSGYERGYTVCNKAETWYPISLAEITDDTEAQY